MTIEINSKKQLSVEDKLKKLDDKKKQILEITREKKKAVSQKRILELGRLVEKAKLHEFDTKLLFGALLEVAERSIDMKTISSWETKANSIEKEDSRIIISFEEKPTPIEAKNLLKKFGFRWNSMRSEYYGRGRVNDVKSTFNSFRCEIESVQ